MSPSDPERFFRKVGYCSQFDSFPKGVTAREFLYDTCRLYGMDHPAATRRTDETLERVDMTAAAERKIAGFSKGMRQRMRLAQAISHHPEVLVLDEPLNGLDPMARSESMALFRGLGDQGMTVIVSSHILHEVDRISDQVVFLSNGYVVAEGQVHGVREEVHDQPIQILVRTMNPHKLAALLFRERFVVEARLQEDGRGLLVRTRSSEEFYKALNTLVLEEDIEIEAVAPADDDVNSVYQYLIGSGGIQ
jgi:ABC-2 type transport system ATP-binding protein